MQTPDDDHNVDRNMLGLIWEFLNAASTTKLLILYD